MKNKKQKVTDYRAGAEKGKIILEPIKKKKKRGKKK